MATSMAEKEYFQLLEEQKNTTDGMRLEQLRKQSEGERKLLVEIIWPVRKTLKGITLEKEIVTLTGVKAYIDAHDDLFRLGLEAEGFVPHAQNATRPKFDFERSKVRSMVALGIHYTPFTFDEMDKKPEVCRRALYEIYGRYGSIGNRGNGISASKLTLYEREMIRYALWLGKPFTLKDAKKCLQKNDDTCRNVIRNLIQHRLARAAKDNSKRNHEYILEEHASRSLWYSTFEDKD